MDGLRNTFTGTNHGNFVQAHRIDYVHVERACAEPLDIGDVRLRTDLPRTLDPGDPECVGREKERARLVEALGQGRNVQLIGPAGIGKTTLLRHAAHRNLLTIPDIEALVWPASRLPDADEILRAVVARCCEFPPDRPIPSPVLRHALTGLRALVIVEDPLCTAEDLATVVGAMPHSRFVVSTDRVDLGHLDVEVLLAGLPVRAGRQLLRSRFNGRLPAATRKRVEELCEGYGHRPDDIIRLGSYLAAARTQQRLVPKLDSDEARLIVPRLVEWLDDHSRAAVHALAALDNAEWGWPLLAAVAGIPTQATAKALRDSMLVVGDGRYRLAAGVGKLEVDVVAVTERITAWVAETVDPQEIAAEITVIEQALRVNLDADRHDLALTLARVTALKLAAARHWGAWGRVLGLGLRAATGAESVRDQIYFRYSIAARKYANGQTEEALELAVALISDGLDTVDDTTADRIRRLADQVGYRPEPPTEPITGLLGLVRQVVTRLPDPVQQFLISHPQAVPAAVIGLVSLLVAGLFTASAPHANPIADPGRDLIVAGTTAPRSTSTTGIPGGPTTSGAATTGPTTTVGGTPIGDPTTGGGGPGPNTGDGSGGSTSPPPTTLSWGFVRDDMQDDNGQPRQLDAPGSAANWTWGIWNMQSPPAGHPTATHLATGWDRIRMPAAGTPGGTVIVTAYDTGTAGAFCQPSGWSQSGGDELIDVRCFTKAGAPTTMRVFVFFAAGSGANPIAGGGARSYVVDDQPTTGVFVPDWQHARNAGNVTRTGVGRYTAGLAGAATGVVELTPIGADPRHCSVVGRHGDSVDLACFDNHGAAVDTAFAASVADNQNFLDDKRKPVGDYLVTNGDPSTQWASGPSVDHPSAGQYHVTFTNGYFPSTVHVTAEGDGRYCDIALLNDYSFKDNTKIYVGCYTATGALADAAFDLLYTSTRIY
ncbi:hypothetical protein [Kutzneria sp. 744]|uniref:hypothetical protein n=1 Tax=Kutzneria sp. (strain 744) TaxID=345341 RepID=UPI0004BB3179|nr:hypothetical protein [Kutzneria sp. 744]